MFALSNILQVLFLGILMLMWWGRIFKPSLEAPFANWQKLEAGTLLGIIVFSAWGALLKQQSPWLEIWYAEQIASVMIGAFLMRICLRYYRKMLMRVVIGLGICGWLVMAAKAGIHHQPIWF